MHKSDFSPFSDPFMLSVDASGVVPVGVRPPPPLRGSSPCEAGQFIPAGFDCRHSQVCKSRNSVSLNSFFQMVLNPQECRLFPYLASMIVPQECVSSHKSIAPRLQKKLFRISQCRKVRDLNCTIASSKERLRRDILSSCGVQSDRSATCCRAKLRKNSSTSACASVASTSNRPATLRAMSSAATAPPARCSSSMMKADVLLSINTFEKFICSPPPISIFSPAISCKKKSGLIVARIYSFI